MVSVALIKAVSVDQSEGAESQMDLMQGIEV